MATTPNIGLTLVETAQAQKEVTVNTALMKLDALLNTGALDKDLTTPPGSPSEGDLYIVAASATDDWSGQDGNIAYFQQTWRFITPNEGMCFWVCDEDATYIYDGSGWQVSASSISDLDDLSDVSIASASHGDVLTYDSVTGGWINDTIAGGGGGGGVSNLNDLGDVTLSSVMDGEVLVYDNGSSDFINQTLAEAGIAAASHSHAASDITSGTLATARLGGGTADSSSFLRGDQTWAAIPGGVSGLDDLDDVNLTSVTDGEVLVYDNGSSDFINQTLAEAGIADTATAKKEFFMVAVSDESTDLTTGTAKLTFRMPYAMTLSAVRANVNTAPTGSTIIVDINEGGGSILSTKLSIDASEKTSTTASSAAAISDSSLADDAEITIDIDQVGSSTAGKGLKVTLIGTRSV